MLFWQRTKTAAQSVTDPIRANREIDLTSILIWLCLGMFGFFTITQHASVFTRAATPDFYQAMWGGTVGLFATTAAAAGIVSFYTPHTKYDRRILTKRTERFALFVLTSVIAIYPVFLLIYGGENGPRLDIFCLALALLPLPIWRIRHLKTRINDLYSVAEIIRKGGSEHGLV